MNVSDLPFDGIWLRDFEFIPKPGEHPDVVCLAARELRSGRTIQLWRDQLDKCRGKPPYPIDDKTVFVDFVSNAESACHLALKWPLVTHVLDLSPIFRRQTNGLDTPAGKGLLGALRYFKIEGIGAQEKEDARARILQGGPFTVAERKWILKYCLSDVDAMVPLLGCLLRDMSELDLRIALHHGEFAAVSAQMEHNGVPIDGIVFRQLADKATWQEIRDAMVPRVDAKYGVYVQGPSGLSFNLDRFGEYLEREGIDWPRTDKGALITRQKVFEGMCKAWPQLEDLRQLRHVRNKMRKIKLAVGSDDRNRTVLWPFQSKTSRTQPKAAQWIFSPAVWLRSLIRPEPGMSVAYIDFKAMEFLIAGVLSDGHCGPVNRMVDAYSGDPYLAFARHVRAISRDASEEAALAIRDNYKVAGLGALYGMQDGTLASRTGKSKFEAGEMLRQHREEFASQYWQWSEDWVQHALQTGRMRTAMGWTCYTEGLRGRQRADGTPGDINTRSIINWPIQTTGADILRMSCVWAARKGIRLLAPVHDALLIEAPDDQILRDVLLVREIMRRASRVVFGGKHELRTDVVVVHSAEFAGPRPDSIGDMKVQYGRYSDKRGVKFWEMVLELLAEVKRAREEEAA